MFPFVFPVVKVSPYKDSQYTDRNCNENINCQCHSIICIIFYSYEYVAKYHKLIDKTNKLWDNSNLYTDKLLFK